MTVADSSIHTVEPSGSWTFDGMKQRSPRGNNIAQAITNGMSPEAQQPTITVRRDINAAVIESCL